jgi:ElaB/YqjD/DUF883 family membrane-anchored ribosome-binding protein
MADTPEAPAKRGRPRKAAASTVAKPKTTAKPKAPKAAAAATARTVAAKAATVKKAVARKAPVIANGVAGEGWSAQIAPLKAKAEKAAHAAADKFNEVDWKSHIDPLKDQATKTARSAAGLAKDKTGTAMQGLAKLISDTAGTVDAKLGPQYGDYARQAAHSVAGAADSLDSKDVDQLMTEARDFVRKSPAVAIGAAAVVGFVLMRLAKGSSSD